MPIPFNTFSIHDLLGFMVMAPLSVVFLLIYWKFDRHLLDLLYGLLIGVFAIACMATFFQDNIVPQGRPSDSIPGAAQAELLYLRIAFAMGLLAIVLQLHFVLRFCRLRNFLARHIGWFYGVLVLAIPALWFPYAFEIASAPSAPTSSWLHAVPWFPTTKPFFAISFMVTWAALQIYTQVVLYKHRDRTAKVVICALTHVGLVRVGFLLAALGTLIDVYLAFTGYKGVATLPVFALIMSIFLAASLVHDRVLSDREKKNIRHEMVLAAAIQKSLLPSGSPRVCSFDLAGWSQPANHTGGDVFDFIPLTGGRWLICIADAAGHGMGSALMIATTRAYIRALSVRAVDPGKLLGRLNSLLISDFQDGRFVTCYLGILDPLAGHLTYASAGHGPLVLARSHGDLSVEKATTFPLATVNSDLFSTEKRELDLTEGDAVILFSDGLFEITNSKGQCLGTERLLSIIQKYSHLDSQSFIPSVWGDVQDYAGNNNPIDDTTLLILERRRSTHVNMAAVHPDSCQRAG